MRVLFAGEFVTLAHVARPIALARGLRAMGHDCAVACSPAAAHHVKAEAIEQLPLQSIPPARFLAALANGSPAYDVATLARYVDDDLQLLQAWRPDLVIGDFRLSLSVSARLAGVPYATITNAYWSVRSALDLPLPVLPLSRSLPLPLAQGLFRLGLRWALPQHVAALNVVRRQHGLAPVLGGLRAAYTDADHVLYADAPGIFPMQAALPAGHHFIGPVLWSPTMALPSWWHELPTDRPLVYANLGSSGGAAALARVARALAGRHCVLLAATAGADAAVVENAAQMRGQAVVRLASYLPGDQASARADVVVCNGGSMTCQQAALLGRPVLGIPSNMDQFMNMSAVVAAGAGLCLRADRLDDRRMQRALDDLLDNPARRAAAVALGDRLRGAPAPEQLHALLPLLAAGPA